MLSPTTTLEAINSLLMGIGEAPVNREDNPGVLDAVLAKSVLLEESRAVQAAGWHFNTRRGLLLLPQAFAPHYIYLPDNTLAVDTVDADEWIDVVAHDNRLFNITDNEYTFLAPVRVDLVLLMPFETLPQQARHYIMIRAARSFQVRTVGSSTLAKMTEADETRALADLRRMENRRADWNALTQNNLGARIRRRKP